MKFHDEFFSQIYDSIIDTYTKGIVSNGDDFLEYYHNTNALSSLLEYFNSDFVNKSIIRDTNIYQQKYFADLFFESIIDAYDNGLISNAEDFLEYIANREDISNFYVMTLAVIADSLEDVYYDMTDVYNSNKIDYAIGSDLDSIGEIIGCPRPQAKRSGVVVDFSLNTPSEVTLTIPTGVVLTSDNGTSFITQEDGVIQIGSDMVSVYAESMGTGTGTRVLRNTIHKIDSDLDVNDVNGLTVNNRYSSSGGRNAFTDEEYRELLMDWVANQVKGSREAYERYFSDFDGLDSYKLIPNWDGSGTLKIVLDPGYPYQLQKAYDDIVKSVAQIDDDITMFAPVRVPLSIYCSVNVDIDQVNPYSETEKDEIKSRVVDGIKTFVKY